LSITSRRESTGRGGEEEKKEDEKSLLFFLLFSSPPCVPALGCASFDVLARVCEKGGQ
jgi:hypothetical protein